jgi:hypothetical protein
MMYSLVLVPAVPPFTHRWQGGASGHARGEGDGEDVVAGRPPEVLDHLAVARPAASEDPREQGVDRLQARAAAVDQALQVLRVADHRLQAADQS